MGESFLRKTLFSVALLLGLSLSLWAQDCPDRAEFTVVDEQVPGGGGEITVTFYGLPEDMQPSQEGILYSLLSTQIGGYVHNPARIDPGFHEDDRVTVSFRPPGTITFHNVPPSFGYSVVLTSSSCQKQFSSMPEGITVKASRK